jgi:hypothetical protein
MMGTRYVVAALTRSGKFRRVCAEARENKAQADKEAQQLQGQFGNDPVVAVTEDTYLRNAERE